MYRTIWYETIKHLEEFQIPIELIERSDNYGFYVNLFDANSNVMYSWPEDIKLEVWIYQILRYG